ncbi:hypothetical protein FNH22_02290 [Fulvivirga sp. M361]|uniref:hypothetical protein n=1 Tax=Fulvivirga sp. M361 TaxID=2594266 RepID=UPI00117A1C00|nr:hypothetical protein [Fulvivirga sp. M361]TRX62170.1 hypothetical protein FNH22_02290 [Fulvivirga sp. M361]
MKKFILTSLLGLSIFFTAQAQEYAVVTTVESIVPMGIGRSRMISNKEDVNLERFTTQRETGTDTNQGQVSRKDLKINNLEETKMLNFFSATGINFRNIASNDAMIASKLTEMTEAGWELAFVTSGVESDAGGTDGKGLFITRFIFKR